MAALKTHLIGRAILDRLARDEAMATCTCMMATEDVELTRDQDEEVSTIKVEYVEYRDPECPVHYGLLPEEVEGF